PRDWSSDVCSSDLVGADDLCRRAGGRRRRLRPTRVDRQHRPRTFSPGCLELGGAPAASPRVSSVGGTPAASPQTPLYTRGATIVPPQTPLNARGAAVESAIPQVAHSHSNEAWRTRRGGARCRRRGPALDGTAPTGATHGRASAALSRRRRPRPIPP